MLRICLLGVAVALVAMACSEQTETFASNPEEDLIEAITANASASPVRPIDDDAVDCVVRGIVDEFGADGLAELGVTPDSPDLHGGAVFVTPDTARRAVDVGMGCIDVPAAINTFMPKGVDLLEDTVECVADQFQSETFRNLFADLLAEGGEPADILSYAGAQLSIGALFLRCLSPDEILRMGEFLN